MKKQFIIKLFIVCFIAEMVIMTSLSVLELDSLGKITEALIDSFVLSAIVAAILHFLGDFKGSREEKSEKSDLNDQNGDSEIDIKENA